MRIARASLAQELSRLVVEALVQIGLTEKDVLGGAIEHTQLPWQVPPLIIEAPLYGAALSEYIDRPTHVNVDHLTNLFSDVLADLRNAPRKVMTTDGTGYAGTYLALPHVRANERQMYFSLPEGFPGAVSDYAGVTLALECAHVLRTNAKISAFESDDDNYYAVLPSGIEIGVRDGLPTMWFEQWDLPVSGMVQELLTSPRGEVWEGCDYNVIAKVRSLCQTYRKSFKEFEAIDWALQTLRIIDGEHALLQCVRGIKTVAYERSSRMALLQEAVEIANRISITDRQRIEALKNMLVPEIMTVSQFTKQLYGYYATVPPVVAPKVLIRIQQGTQELLEREQMLYAKVRPGTQFD